MSNINLIVKCDCCGQPGKRRLGCMVPEHWFYIESKIAHSTKQRVHVVYACSEECRDGSWKRGPGPGVVDESGTDRMRDRENRQ